MKTERFSTRKTCTKFFCSAVAMRYFALCELGAVGFSHCCFVFDLIFSFLMRRIIYCLPEFSFLLAPTDSESDAYEFWIESLGCTLSFGIHTQYILLNHFSVPPPVPTPSCRRDGTNFHSLIGWLIVKFIIIIFIVQIINNCIMHSAWISPEFVKLYHSASARTRGYIKRESWDFLCMNEAFVVHFRWNAVDGFVSFLFKDKRDSELTYSNLYENEYLPENFLKEKRHYLSRYEMKCTLVHAHIWNVR